MPADLQWSDAPIAAIYSWYARYQKMEALVTFLKEEEGLTTVEYAIAGGLVGAAVVAAFVDLGDAVEGVITFITGELNTAGP
jgi:pilus assembly protein Flp/PilA